MNSNYFSNYNIVNVYNKKSIKSGLVTQILYGEKFKIISKYRKWCKIKLRNDGYKGYIIKKKFISKFKPTHKVCNLFAKLYSKPSFKSKPSLKTAKFALPPPDAAPPIPDAEPKLSFLSLTQITQPDLSHVSTLERVCQFGWTILKKSDPTF